MTPEAAAERAGLIRQIDDLLKLEAVDEAATVVLASGHQLDLQNMCCGYCKLPARRWHLIGNCRARKNGAA